MIRVWFGNLSMGSPRRLGTRPGGRSARSWMAIAVAVVLTAGVAGCGGVKLASVWKDREVTIDGVPEEWHGATTWVENPNVAVGVINDGDYLYLCFSTPVKSIASEVVERGLVIWLDPRGKANKVFGIRCPIGRPGNPDSAAGAGARAPAGAPPGAPPGGTGEMPGRDASRRGPLPGAPPDTARLRETSADMIRSAGGWLQVLMPASRDTVLLDASKADGLRVGFGHDSGRFVYELRVPLKTGPGQPYAIGYERGGKISIGFETPPSAEANGREEVPDHEFTGGGMGGPGEGEGEGGPGGGPGGGGFGGPGGPPGGPGGRRERGVPSAAEPLEIWGTIRLATGP